MMRLIVGFSVAVFCLSAVSEATKCDDNIINQIKKQFWSNGANTPAALLTEGASLSPLYVSATSGNYYANQNDISCLYANFKGSKVELVTQLISGSTTDTVFTVSEQSGALYDAANGVYRYYLGNSKGGVRPLYRCSATGATGAPEGLIEASAQGYDVAAVAQATADLASLGIIASKQYATTCAP